MAQVEITQETLTSLLKAAEQAHGVYESSLGHRDEDWPSWYAAYILKQLQQTSDRPATDPAATNATETNQEEK